MKVLQVINSLDTGGAEKLTLESVPLLQQQSINVDVLILKDNDSYFRQQLGNKTNGRISGLTKKSIYNPFLIFKIMSFTRKYDLIHFHLFPTLYWVVIAKSLSFSKAKLVYTEHNTSNRRRGNVIFRLIDRFIYKKINKIITIANEVDSNLKNYLNIREDKFALINNGVDISLFNNALSYSKKDFFEKDDFIIIQVSSFSEQKDQKTLIKSLKGLPIKFKLLLVGEGALLNDCKQFVNELNLTNRVKFLGNRSDVARLLKTADVVVLSSNYEGLSLSNIEGMSVNKPFVGSDVEGIREIVKDYGLLFKKGDAKELAILLEQLYNDDVLYKNISKQCLNRAQQFDITKMVNKYALLYKELFKNKK